MVFCLRSVHSLEVTQIDSWIFTAQAAPQVTLAQQDHLLPVPEAGTNGHSPPLCRIRDHRPAGPGLAKLRLLNHLSRKNGGQRAYSCPPPQAQHDINTLKLTGAACPCSTRLLNPPTQVVQRTRVNRTVCGFVNCNSIKPFSLKSVFLSILNHQWFLTGESQAEGSVDISSARLID